MYIKITSTTDWFFVHHNNSKLIVLPLVAWGLTADGKTIGLLGASVDAKNGLPTLTAVPPVAGRYLHREQLSKQEREILARSLRALQLKALTSTEEY